MAIGCNFICDNENCEHHGKMISLTGPWPMIAVDHTIDILSTGSINDREIAYAQTLKNQGREFMCLTLPRTESTYKLEIEASRIQKWCGNCNIISVFEAKDQDEVEEISTREDTCMGCETEILINFMDAVQDGIQCPFCQTTMKQERWFANDDDGAWI